LIVLLLIPTLGLLIAALMVFNDARSAANPPTPLPVTAPPLPTLPDPDALVDAEVMDFSLPSLNGGTLTLSQYQGRVIFLNFWATWCEPCQRELPAFQQFMQEQADDPNGAVIIAVNYGESASVVQTYLQSVGVTNIPVALDEDGTAADQYGVFNLPVTFVIDQNGLVRYPKYGEMTLQDLQAYTDELS
jgi:thiol-disulfide isomerase/thioredoxin